MTENLLGLAVSEAVQRLRARGVEPVICESRAPRRPEGGGALRVVRVRNGGRELTVCGFHDLVTENAARENKPEELPDA